MSNGNFDKPGSGSAFAPKNGKASQGAPDYKGHIILPDGSIIGVAVWEKQTRERQTFLSFSIDDREGEFQAKRLKLELTRLGGGDDRRDDRGGTYRDHGGNRDRSSNRDDRDQRGGYRNDDRRNEQRGRDDNRQRRFSDDLDDDIPF